MNISPITPNQNFKGRVIVQGKINKQQNYLFNLHKQALEKMVENQPFDLIVSQSKNRKTVSLKSSIDDLFSLSVFKNEQNYEQIGTLVVENAIKKQKIKDMEIKANQLLDCKKMSMYSILVGNFKDARKAEKQYAELAVENFDIVKKMPKVNFVGVPLSIFGKAVVNGLKYRVYRAFTKSTPQEKQLAKMAKAYQKELASEHKKIETVNIPFPRMAF